MEIPAAMNTLNDMACDFDDFSYSRFSLQR